MSWYWYLIIIFFLLLGILLSEVKIRIFFNKEEKNDYLKVDFWFLYFIHYKKEIPLLELGNTTEGLKYSSESNINNSGFNNDKKNRITIDKIKEKYQDYKLIINRIHNFKLVIQDFAKHVHIIKYKWESTVGTGEAAYTGIINGIIWSLKGIITGLISNSTIFEKKPEISVKPEYNNKIFHSRIECILRFRVGYFIITGIHLLLKYLLGGRKKWRENTQFKA